MLLSGSDMSRFAFVDPFWRPREYATELADRLKCDVKDTWKMVDCLRDNQTVTWQNILYHASQIIPHVRLFIEKLFSILNINFE